MPQNELVHDLGLDDYKFGFVTDSTPVFRTRPGLDAEIVRQISARSRTSPHWMLAVSAWRRLKTCTSPSRCRAGAGTCPTCRRRWTRHTST